MIIGESKRMLIASQKVGGQPTGQHVGGVKVHTSPVDSLTFSNCFKNVGDGSPYLYYEIVVLGIQPASSVSQYATLGVQFLDSGSNPVTDANYCTVGFANDSGSNHAFTYDNAGFIPLNNNINQTGPQANTGVFAKIHVYDPSGKINDSNKSIDIWYNSPQAYSNKGCINLSSGSYLGQNLGSPPITNGILFSFFDSLGNTPVEIASGMINIYGYTDPTYQD